jgi:hypothetical protein
MSQTAMSSSLPSNSLEYKASGLKHSLHGVIYQLKLLMLFVNRGLDYTKSFRLATEMDDAEKFDDVVFLYKDHIGKDVIRFLQAKHKQDQEKKISRNDLLTDTNGDFSLQKYFIAYLKIAKNPAFSGAEFKDFIIFPNINFNEEIDGWFEPIVGNDPILSMKSQNRKARLMRISLTEFKGKNEKLLDRLQNISNLRKPPSKKKRHSLPDNRINKDVMDFLRKLVFAVNQPNECELWDIIKSEISEFSGIKLTETDLIASDFQTEILNWMKMKQGTYFTDDQGREISNGIRQKIVKLMFVGITKDHRIKLDNVGITFEKGQADLHEFLKNKNRKQIFNLIVQGKVILGSVLVHQTISKCSEINYINDDSCIFVSVSCLLRLKTLIKQAIQSTNLLVIEFGNLPAESLINLYLDLCKNFKLHSNRKFVLITEEFDSSLTDFPFKFHDSFKEKYEEHIVKLNFKYLTQKSQNKLLTQGTVNFQGMPMPLIDLMSEKDEQLIKAIDGEMLCKILNSAEIRIGNPLTDLNEVKYYVHRTLQLSACMDTEFEEDSSWFIVRNKTDVSKLQLDKIESQNVDIVVVSLFSDCFDQLSDHEKLKDCNIHWFLEYEGLLLWQCTRGKISRLRKRILREVRDAIDIKKRLHLMIK